MKRIRLSPDAKRALRLLLAGAGIPDGLERAWFVAALYELEEAGLVRLARVEGGDVESACISDKGFKLMASNPSLRNPTDWARVAAFAAVASALMLREGLSVGAIPGLP